MTTALDFMRRGALVPDSTVWEMVRERAGCLRCLGGFLLDGFPRTLSQAQSLDQLLQEEKIPLTAVVNYELPIPEIVARLSGRRTCQRCKAIFHIAQQPPKSAGICDHCGAGLYQREDDRPEAITVRLEVYEHSTAPLIQFYRQQGLLLAIPATGSPVQIADRTMNALDQRTQLATNKLGGNSNRPRYVLSRAFRPSSCRPRLHERSALFPPRHEFPVTFENFRHHRQTSRVQLFVLSQSILWEAHMASPAFAASLDPITGYEDLRDLTHPRHALTQF